MGEFVRHESCDVCGSSDGKAIYSDGSHFCWVCEDVKASDDFLEEKGIKRSSKSNSSKERKEVIVSEKEKITQEQNEALKAKTSSSGSDYRSINDETLKFFGVRTEYDSKTDEVCATYYPCTEGGELVGYKCRNHPKSFGTGNVGRTGKSCDLFGQFRFTRPGKYVLIVGGEHDQLAAFQMLQNYSKSKGHDYDTPVVSPTVGETGCDKQLAAQYDFFNQYEKIILGFDNDQAGLEAAEKALRVLPKGKVFLAKWSKKDPNEMLEKGLDKQFIQDFYSAKQFVPDGIIASNQLSDKIREELMTVKIPLPPFMHKLQDMMAGGIPLGRIVNMGSASGTGKSTIVDEMIYYWIFNSPHLVGIVTLESSVGQYGIKLLSRHISNKLELRDNETALSIVNSEHVKQKEQELFNNPDGTPRFFLIDERDGGIDSLKNLIDNLVIGCGCKVIICDPLQDILDGLSNEDQALFMKYQKGLVKSHNISFININHVRKNATGQKANSTGGELYEEDLQGSSAIFKSGACNLLFTRNKEAEDAIERNTTYMKATKIRWTGKTGQAGAYYYDIETHTLHDLDEFMMNRKEF